MNLPFMPFFVDDYNRDTQGLSAMEHAGYLLLIFAYWRAQAPLENNDKKLSMIARMTPKQWASVKGEVLSFFTEVGGKLVHKRIEEELEIAKKKVAQAAAAGRASGESRRNGR